MPAKVFCVASPKGGSGKTTLSATFGAFLADLKKKVLIIDADAATNGLTLFYLDEIKEQRVVIENSQKRIPKGIFEICSKENSDYSVHDKVPDITILSNGVHLIPSIYEFKDTETVPKISFEKSLIEIISGLKPVYDYIFIDAQAGSDECAKICMNKRVSDEVIIVSEWDPLSNNGILRLSSLMKEDLTQERTWILYNKLLPDFAKAYAEYLKQIYSKELPPVQWNANVVKSYVNLKLYLNLEKGNKHTLSMIRVIRKLLGDSISSDLDKWMQAKAEMIQGPLHQELNNIDSELKRSYYELDKLKRDSELFKATRMLKLGISGIAIISVLIFGIGYYTKFFDFQSIFLLLTGLGIIVFGISYLFARRSEEPDYYYEMDNLLSRRELLRERKKELEILKSANLETLLELD